MHPAKDGFAALPFFDEFDLSTVDILLLSQYVIPASFRRLISVKNNFLLFYEKLVICKNIAVKRLETSLCTRMSHNFVVYIRNEANYLISFPCQTRTIAYLLNVATIMCYLVFFWVVLKS
jgi:hypothetical protein